MIQRQGQSRCGQYQIVTTLGKGAQAKVKLGRGADNQLVAIKMYQDKCVVELINCLAKEFDIIRHLDHPNLIKVIEANPQMQYVKANQSVMDRVCLVQEYAAGGELFNYIALTGRFTEGQCRFYFRQLTDGLKYLHCKEYAHRDLKPDNFLLDRDYNLKIADFGLSQKLNKYNNNLLKTQLGTQGYHAPEMLAKQDYSGEAIDAFAAGVNLFIMYTGFPPFKDAIPQDKQYRNIAFKKHDIFWNYYQNLCRNHYGKEFTFSEDFKILINGLLELNPKDRWTIQQAIDSAWLAGPTPTLAEVSVDFKQRHEAVNKRIINDKIIAKQEKLTKSQKTNQPHAGIGKFKSGVQCDFSEVNEKFQLNQKDRRIKTEDELLGQFRSCKDKDYLLRYILDFYLSDNFTDIVKVSQSNYKFELRRTFEEEKDPIELQVEFKWIDEDTTSIRFYKISGHNLYYQYVVREIQELVENIKL